MAPFAALCLIVSPMFGAEGRVRIENGGGTGQVRVVLSDQAVVETVTISMAGGAAGELVTVEAPAPRVRLAGGTLEGDPLLEASVRDKLRSGGSAPQTVSVLPAPPSPRVLPSDRYLNHVFTDVGFAYAPGWGWPAGTWTREHRSFSERRMERPHRPSPRTATSRPAGGSFSARAMMPRR